MFLNAGAQNGKMFSGGAGGGSGSCLVFFVFAAMLMGFFMG
jgi:hypothetical protein